uniref:Beta-defensin-like domain-containing protein n=1 Tax=Pelusios castaneus TaxID=367368 RepID=A0A8C8SBG7_9SAUR
HPILSLLAAVECVQYYNHLNSTNAQNLPQICSSRGGFCVLRRCPPGCAAIGTCGERNLCCKSRLYFH